VTLSAPLAQRWQRAQQIDRSTIRLLGPYRFLVPSQRTSSGYAVELEFDQNGRLITASCECPDFTKSATRPSTPTLHGIRVCKHILAAALHATNLLLPATAPRSSQPSLEDMLAPSSEAREATPSHPKPLDAGFPAAGEPAWDDVAMEWYMHDADGWVYWGESAAQCMHHYREQMQRLAEHARKSGMSIEELRELNARERDRREQCLDERPY